MAEVKVLLKGYYRLLNKNKETTSPTITLIKDKNIVMVVDPGILKSQKILTDALKKENLDIKDVNFVAITHSHIDHYRNVGMFPDAKVVEFFGVWDKDTVENWNEQFSKDIKIIKTPGHSRTGITFLVNTKKGIVAVAGDVFWKENLPVDDPYAENHPLLKESRAKVIELADYIVPGHGDIYKVKK